MSFTFFNFPSSFWPSGVFYLNFNSSLFLYLFAFAVVSLSCIVIATVSSQTFPNQSCQAAHVVAHIHPISSSPIEEITTLTHFFHYTFNSSNSSILIQSYQDIENQNHTRNDQYPKLENAFSQVTLTFGSDKPEVYMKMAEQAQKSVLCRCPCNHRSPELAAFPHASNTSTVSSDLSVRTHLHEPDSLSSVASKKPSMNLETNADTSVQCYESAQHACAEQFPMKETYSFDTPTSGWIMITDAKEESGVEEHNDELVIARNDVTCGIAYTKMRTMVPFVDPAMLIQWITLKIVVSLFVFAKGIYDHAVDNAVFRRFHH